MAELNNVIINYSDKFIEYKYIISEFFILLNGETIKIPTERISDFKIENYFEEASFPIFKVSLILEPSRYREIIKNKKTVKFKVRIQKYYNTSGKQDKSMLTDAINDTFILFPDDEDEDFQKELKDEAGTSNDINELTRLNNVVELFLFKDTIVTGLRSLFNDILTNCTMCTAVTYLLYKAGVKNILMSPFENTKVYGSILLPPQSIERQIKFLNNNYGFHKAGTVVYFGLFHSYILNYKGGCTAWYNKEWTETVIYILEKSNTKSFLSGTIQKYNEERYYFNASSEGISIKNKSVSSNVLTGTDAVTIDMKNSKTTEKSSGAITVGNSNSAVLFNNTSNEFMESAYTAQQKANATVITLILENVNIEAFNPNKAFYIICESPTLNGKYKGLYRIATSIFNFTANGEDYIVTAALTLKKVG